MNTAPRLRIIDVLLIALSTIAMLTALSLHAQANENLIQEMGCPKGAKDDQLTFQRIMINFGRYTMTADSVARQDADWLFKNKPEVEKSVQDLSLAIACSEAAIANRAILYPAGAQQYSPETRAIYIEDYGNWLEKYLVALQSYKAEASRLLSVIENPESKSADVDLGEFVRIAKLVKDIADDSHRVLSTATWCDSLLQPTKKDL